MKFGGASTHTSAGIRNVTRIINAKLAEQPLIVVSAIGKTTRNIEQCAHEAAAGNAESAYHQLDELIAFHVQLATQVISPELYPAVERRIAELGLSLRSLLKGLSIVKELSPRSLDACRAHGEKFASAIITEALKKGGMPVHYIPAEKIIITDKKYGRASVVDEPAKRNAQKYIIPAVEKNSVVLTEGYIGAAEDGTPTTMGKESSDYTASLLGALCGAVDIQIWTDVNGMMTADPRIVPEAKTIEELSYDEAEEMAALGAKILHPLTIVPARTGNIPIHIKNSTNSENPGTIIHSATRRELPAKVEAVTLIESVSISDHNGEALFQLASPGGHVRFTNVPDISGTGDHSAVSAVGEGVGKEPSLLRRMIATLEPMGIKAVLFGASQNSISVILSRTNGEPALRALHKEFL